MITFWLVATVMMIVAALFVILPILQKNQSYNSLHNDVNVGLARNQLQEWHELAERNEITHLELDRLRSDLEHTLLVELRTDPTAGKHHLPRLPLTIALILVLAFSISYLYYTFGTPSALHSNTTGDVSKTLNAAPSVSPPSVDELLAQLNQRLMDDPDDERGWSLLAPTLMSLGRYSEAVRGYANWLRVAGDKPEILVGYAFALTMEDSGNFDKKSTVLLERALSINPDHPEGLWLSGLAARAAGNLKQALDYWYRAELLLRQQGSSDTLKKMIVETEQALLREDNLITKGTNIFTDKNIEPNLFKSVHVTITVSTTIAELISTNDVLFVYARIPGVDRPIAAIRQTISTWPITLTLDDASSNMSTVNISDLASVTIGAHISRSGNAIAESGDFIADPISVTLEGVTKVHVTISSVHP